MPNVQVVSGSSQSITALKQATVFHFTGHAEFDFNQPMNSTLKNSDGELFTLLDVYCNLRLPKTELVFLSACQSGMRRPNLLDEFDGFPTAFLYAGAKCVICSLWKVHDLPATLLVDRFYTNWKSGLPIGKALEMARRWLRGVPDHKQSCLSCGEELKRYVSDRKIMAVSYTHLTLPTKA